MTATPLVKIMADLTNCSDYCKPRAFSADRSAGSLSLQGVHGGATLVSKLKITYLKQEGPTNVFAICIKAMKIAVIFKLSWR